MCTGEGGGQLLRNTVAYGAILQRQISVNKIRAGRKVPGLRVQHLTGIQAVCALVNGNLEGGAIESTEIIFSPGARDPTDVTPIVADCGTAGACTLICQTVLPVLLLGSAAEMPVNIIGGTDVPFSPPVDFITNVTLPLIQRFGAQVTLTVSHSVQTDGGLSRVESAESQISSMYSLAQQCRVVLRHMYKGTVFSLWWLSL